MGDAGQSDEQHEVFGDELRTIIADDPWFRVGMVLQRPLHDNFHILFGHRFAEFPMHDGAAVTIQHARQVVERSIDVDVGDVHVPMLVRTQ